MSKMNNKGIEITVEDVARKLRPLILKKVKNSNERKHIKAASDYDIVGAYLTNAGKEPDLDGDEQRTVVDGVIDDILSVEDFCKASDWLRTLPLGHRLAICKDGFWRAEWLLSHLNKGERK